MYRIQLWGNRSAAIAYFAISLRYALILKVARPVCVVIQFCMQDNLDVAFMRNFFAGLAQCGAWACLDEFNRIEAPVLSVVSAQLKTIQSALIGMVKTFHFEGREITLNPMCGFFITMNPGYAGMSSTCILNAI